MTYEELINWGHKHYNDGGDVFVECWAKSDFDAYCREFGPMTERDAESMARMYKGVEYGEMC